MVKMRAAAAAWRMQAMTQAFRRWHADMLHWQHVKQVLSVIAGASAKALLAAGFARYAVLMCEDPLVYPVLP